MASFNYRAVDAHGVVVSGSLEANNEHALEAQLRQSGIEMLRCAEQGRGLFRRRSRVTRKELIGFCFHMEQMTRLSVLSQLVSSRANCRMS